MLRAATERPAHRRPVDERPRAGHVHGAPVSGVAVSVFTDGRGDYLDETIASFDEMVKLPVGAKHWRTIFDDSGNPDYYRRLVDKHGKSWAIISWPTKQGFGGTISRAWRFLSHNLDHGPEFVFHLEDDFTFDRDVEVAAMIHLLETRPYLAQVALRRQAWSPTERHAGGVVELHPDAYIEGGIDTWNDPAWPGERPERGVHWLEHRLFFTTNPSVYRRSLCARGWPDGPQSEGQFSADLFSDPDTRCAYWGRRSDPPWVEHIGRQRVGGGY